MLRGDQNTYDAVYDYKLALEDIPALTFEIDEEEYKKTFRFGYLSWLFA